MKTIGQPLPLRKAAGENSHDGQSARESGESTLLEEIKTTLSAHDGTSIFARAWVPGDAKCVLVCVQGLGGHGGYYEALAGQLASASAGTVVVAPDLRGHGRSEGVRGNIDRFERYLEDVDAAIAWGRTYWPDKPLIMLGESMGASIAIQYIVRSQKSNSHATIAGLVLVSPVLRPAISPSMREVVRFLHSLLVAPSRPSILVTGREELGCRDADFNALLRADPLFVRLVSVRFLNSLTSWLRQSRRKARQIQLPLLVLQGGRDYVARPAATVAFLRLVPARDQRLVTFPEAYHCLLYDPDTPVLVKTLASWLIAHSQIAPADTHKGHPYI